MYVYKSRVAFQEVPDGILTDFTTAESFYPGSLIVVQGALVWTDYTTPAVNTVRFGTAPRPVAEAGELLIATGLFGSGEMTYPVGPWDAAAFQQERGLTDHSLTLLIPALEDADAFIQSIITVAAYTDACLTTPTDPLAHRKIKKAIGDLAMIYLRQRNLIAPAASGYSENYSGIVSYNISSSGKAAEASTLAEGAILNTLSAYFRPVTFAAASTTWGTGRFIGVLTVELDE